jgi:hypothetical protein
MDGRFTWAEAGVLDPSGDAPFLAAQRSREKDQSDLRGDGR